MNILFFITPKSEVACVYEEDSLRQALERMEYHQYSSVPILNRNGEYAGTLTEGDLLWGQSESAGSREYSRHCHPSSDGQSAGQCKV